MNNNTPNQLNPRPEQPSVRRPARAVRQPGSSPQPQPPQTDAPAVHRPTAPAPQTVQQAKRPTSPAPQTVRQTSGQTPPAAQAVSQPALHTAMRPNRPIPSALRAELQAKQNAAPAPRPASQSAQPKPNAVPRSSAEQKGNARSSAVRSPQAVSAPQPRPNKPVSDVKTEEAGAPTTQTGLARRMAEVDNTATRRMDAVRIAEKKAPAHKNGGSDGKEKKNKKQMSEGVATLLSIVKAITYIVFVIVIAGFLSYYTIFIANDMFAFVKSDELVTITVPENATIYDVSDVLADGGIIAYPEVFELYAKLNHDDGKFVAGDYEINGMMNYDELLMAFKERKVRDRIWLTIPEGYSIDEMIDLFLENDMGGTREDWVAAVNNLELYAESFPFVKALIGNLDEDRTYALEGYLFPDTYEFYTDAKASQIVYKLLNRFNNVFRDDFYTRASELGYTVDEIMILASMIEKETRFYHEFEQVSSVFHNRLHNAANYPYLESDATIQYAIRHDTGERKEEMTRDDWGYESAYNTYTNRGLPPGPIANPSYQAITCALYPEETNYYFFVSRKNGETIFSSTIDEHNAAVAEVSRGG